MKIVIATANPGKFKELSEMLRVGGIEYVPISSFTDEDIEETGDTYIENAIIKARFAAQISNLSSIADDSGLEINALDGYPGITSARCAGENATDEDKIEHIIQKMKYIYDRSARFVCSLAYVDSNNSSLPSVFTGIVEGKILNSQFGKADEGLQYDSIFFYPPFATTFSAISNDKKNSISHRGNACRKMTKYLNLTVRGINRGFGNI